MFVPEPGTVTMFSTTWCGFCRRLRGELDRQGLSYTTVDIEQNPSAAEMVRSVNKGNETVPTVMFADGTTLTNPSADQVRARLAR
jgi:mycoredoxin